jgi:hypothetical protein
LIALIFALNARLFQEQLLIVGVLRDIFRLVIPVVYAPMSSARPATLLISVPNASLLLGRLLTAAASLDTNRWEMLALNVQEIYVKYVII